MAPWLLQLLQLIGVFAVGAVASQAWAIFEKLPLALDKLPAWIKPAAVAIVAAGVNALGALMQVSLPADLHLWTADTVHALLAAAFAWALHMATSKLSVAKAPAVAAPPAKSGA